MDSPSKHLMEVSKAVEFEKVKKLPKFSHAHMAIINPIHKERRSLSPSGKYHNLNILEFSVSQSPQKQEKIKLMGSPMRYEKRESVPKILPDHLIRAPMDVLMEPAQKEKSIEEIIRQKEAKTGKKMTAKERKEAIDKEKKKIELRKKLTETRDKAKVFFKECQNKLEELNEKQDNKPNAWANGPKSVIGSLFNNSAKGVRKLYFELMGHKSEKLTRPKFLEFARKIMQGGKLTDGEIKDLFMLFCKKNKKTGGKPKNVKVIKNHISNSNNLLFT